ncbi:MAG: methyl-accepting chemotaxis protein [Gemmatimonadales bacterium]|nr:methyl-accepting chemotaxis protein [Gemmatimonadales bacterium]MDZ4390982.1 methyl-accepting chemotaxis protein [Gemmatimonadales bacterium]
MTSIAATPESTNSRAVPLALTTAWPLLGAAASIAIGVVIGSGVAAEGFTSTLLSILFLLAVVAGGCGLVAVWRTPAAAPLRPLVGIAASVASLLALTPIDQPAATAPLSFFLLTGVWHYALTPLAVHFALAIGWPHRVRYWNGVVIGWYILHAAMFVAASSGIATGEAPLVAAVDTLFRLRILEPAGVFVALSALGLAMMAPLRRGAQRQATVWAFAAIAVGLGPMVVMPLLPVEIAAINDLLSPYRLALLGTAVLGLAAVLSLPFVNPVRRDLLAFDLGQRLLDERDLAAALREVAVALQETFEADGVAVRLVDPPLVATIGTLRGSSGAPPPQIETVDDGRAVVAPIGRGSDPFGDIRLESPHAGAFGKREEQWLEAFLGPVGIALRSRRREQLLRQRVTALSRALEGNAEEIAAALVHLPPAPHDDGMGVPPPVDAREVLGQLSDGLGALARRGEELELVSHTARDRAREASDEVARALDALRRVLAELLHLGAHADEIGVHNRGAQAVAFRTNLLANNAALEASRAGTAGRTFGVLAEEIRRLADDTASSASTIERRAAALASDLSAIGATTEQLQDILSAAIREAEAGEEAARRMGEVASTLLGDTRSLNPAVEEAHMVAQRRSARDHHLTATLERFLNERAALARSLTQHRRLLMQIEEGLRSAAGGIAGARRGGSRGEQGERGKGER